MFFTVDDLQFCFDNRHPNKRAANPCPMLEVSRKGTPGFMANLACLVPQSFGKEATIDFGPKTEYHQFHLRVTKLFTRSRRVWRAINRMINLISTLAWMLDMQNSVFSDRWTKKIAGNSSLGLGYRWRIHRSILFAAMHRQGLLQQYICLWISLCDSSSGCMGKTTPSTSTAGSNKVMFVSRVFFRHWLGKWNECMETMHWMSWC